LPVRVLALDRQTKSLWWPLTLALLALLLLALALDC
jgi:hypothetical protein